MKKLLFLVGIGLLLTGSAFSYEVCRLSRTSDTGLIQYQNYHPRGEIRSSTGNELYPPLPSTLTRK